MESVFGNACGGETDLSHGRVWKSNAETFGPTLIIISAVSATRVKAAWKNSESYSAVRTTPQ